MAEKLTLALLAVCVWGLVNATLWALPVAMGLSAYLVAGAVLDEQEAEDAFMAGE